MTRVEKINQAIHYMVVNKGMCIREIHAELLKHHIELTMPELITIVASFGLKPVQPRQKTQLQIRRSEFHPIMDSLLRIASTYRITNAQLAEYLNAKNLTYPCKAIQFTKKTLDSLINSYDFRYPRASGCVKSPFNTVDDLVTFIDSKLTQEQKNLQENWKKINVRQSD